MTNEDAKSQLEMAKGIIARLGKDWLDERDYPVLDLAIQALDKQIPPKKNYEEDCPFCKEHEQGETLYMHVHWDGGCWIRYKLFENILAEMPTIKNPIAKIEQHKDFEWIPCTPNTKFDEFKEFWVTMLNGDVRRLYYRPNRELYPWTNMYGTFGFNNDAIAAYILIEEPEPYNNTV